MDEKPYQLLGETREALPMIPGSDRKTDSECVCNGTVSIFAFIEPLGGMHHVNIREHRTAFDWEAERNMSAAKVNWHFRTSDAWIKLSSLYPRFTIAQRSIGKSKYQHVSTPDVFKKYKIFIL